MGLSDKRYHGHSITSDRYMARVKRQENSNSLALELIKKKGRATQRAQPF